MEDKHNLDSLIKDMIQADLKRYDQINLFG